jgi:hypothetical protein
MENVTHLVFEIILNDFQEKEFQRIPESPNVEYFWIYSTVSPPE